MTQRTILAGMNPNVVIRTGASVSVKGYAGDQISVTANNIWGLKLEKKSESEIARARAAIGDFVLFDVHVNWKKSAVDVFEVELGGSGKVIVPIGANVKVYAGKDLDVSGIQGRVDAFSGRDLNLENIDCLGNASAGWKMNVNCQTLCNQNVEFQAGSDLRFHVQDLTSAFFRIKDIGGYWEALIGKGERKISLKCGGDVIIVTDQIVEGLPPNYMLGRIEKPGTELPESI
jgi:hypothetical protein